MPRELSDARGASLIFENRSLKPLAGSDGSSPGQFDIPGGIAVNPVTNTVYVADTSNNWIQTFTQNGRFNRAWGTVGIRNGTFIYPAWSMSPIRIITGSRNSVNTAISSARGVLRDRVKGRMCPDGEIVCNYFQGEKTGILKESHRKYQWRIMIDILSKIPFRMEQDRNFVILIDIDHALHAK